VLVARRRRRRVGIFDSVVIVDVGVDATESGSSKTSTSGSTRLTWNIKSMLVS
jgi:hypothetical protein